MLRIWRCFAILLITGTFLAAWGCGRVQTKSISTEKQAPAPPLEQVKSMLKSYANGQPMMSEAENFPALIEEVKKTDPQKGRILEEGFKDLQRAGPNLAEQAQALLRKL
jgi:indole-3-glycerol phosphate synthase